MDPYSNISRVPGIALTGWSMTVYSGTLRNAKMDWRREWAERCAYCSCREQSSVASTHTGWLIVTFNSRSRRPGASSGLCWVPKCTSNTHQNKKKLKIVFFAFCDYNIIRSFVPFFSSFCLYITRPTLFQIHGLRQLRTLRVRETVCPGKTAPIGFLKPNGQPWKHMYRKHHTDWACCICAFQHTLVRNG